MDTAPSPPTPDIAPAPLPSQIGTAPARPLREPLRLVLFALGIGLLADALFRGGATGVGINVPITVCLFLASLLSLGRREGVAPNRAALALFVPPLLFFASMLAVRANPSLGFFNLIGCGVITSLLVYFWSDGNPMTAPFGAWLALPWKAFGGSVAAAFPVLRIAGGEVAMRGERHERWAAVGRGALLALPILFVFAALFAGADAVFARRAAQAWAWLFPSDWETHAGRLGWTVLTAVLATGGLAHSLARRETPGATVVRKSARLGFTESAVILGAVCALFGAFLATQIGYLFGGDGRVQSVADLTYAKYAHRGFAELNIVAVLTLTLIGGLKAFTDRDTPKRARVFSLLGTALLALTFPLLLSSFVRMTAYEAAYGATGLRLHVDVFIAWLAVGLLWCGVTLWRPVPGGVGVYVCAAGFLLTLNVLDPDREIARRNLERYKQTGRIDRLYLATLSEDALPELMRLRYSPAPEDREMIRQITGDKRPDSNGDKFGAWNFSRNRAHRLAEAHKRD